MSTWEFPDYEEHCSALQCVSRKDQILLREIATTVKNSTKYDRTTHKFTYNNFGDILMHLSCMKQFEGTYPNNVMSFYTESAAAIKSYDKLRRSWIHDAALHLTQETAATSCDAFMIALEHIFSYNSNDKTKNELALYLMFGAMINHMGWL